MYFSHSLRLPNLTILNWNEWIPFKYQLETKRSKIKLISWMKSLPIVVAVPVAKGKPQRTMGNLLLSRVCSLMLLLWWWRNDYCWLGVCYGKCAIAFLRIVTNQSVLLMSTPWQLQSVHYNQLNLVSTVQYCPNQCPNIDYAYIFVVTSEACDGLFGVKDTVVLEKILNG